MIRLSDAERAVLDDLAKRLCKASASDVFRFLVHRERRKLIGRAAREDR